MAATEAPRLTGADDTAYELRLTAPELKMTWVALHSLLDDFGREEEDVRAIVRSVLDKLPDEHAIRAIRIG